MAFLPKFANRDGYVDANIWQFARPRERERREPTSSVKFEYGPNSYDHAGTRGMFGPALQSRGMIDKVGGSGRPTDGLLGIQNTTGFAQEAPNVVYDQGPEQFAQEMKLRKQALEVERMKAEGLLENNRALNETRRQNADANSVRAQVADFRARNPNMLLKETADGIVAIDPQSGQAINTGIRGLRMAEEAKLGLQNQNALQQIGARGANALSVQELRNSGILDAIGARGLGALELEELRQSGAIDRLVRTLEGQKNNAIYREGQNTWRTRLKEGLVNPEDPVEGQPPSYPRGDINLPPENRPDTRSTPLGSVGTVMPSGESGVSLQLKPNQMSGFEAAPGQFVAKPGQFRPGGTPSTVNAPVAQNPAELKANAEAILRQQGKPVTEANLKYVMDALAAQQSGGTTSAATTVGAGQTGKPGAGTLTGRSAGSVR